MTNLLIMDTETGGLEPDQHPLLEVAAALWSVKSRELLWSYSTLLDAAGENEEAALKANGITDELRADFHDANQACDGVSAIGSLMPIVELCRSGAVGVLAAHNAKFDRPFLEREAGGPLRGPDEEPLLWVCTEQDIRYPRPRNSSRSLGHLAVDHEIAVGVRHRALADVLLVCELLKQVEDLEGQLEEAMKPRALFEAIVSYDDRQLAKDHGFRWDGDGTETGTPKTWWKVLPFDTSQRPTPERQFPVNLLRPA